ncbi:hypothetical protein ACFW04_005253 [Cataglyphis niger]
MFFFFVIKYIFYFPITYKTSLFLFQSSINN